MKSYCGSRRSSCANCCFDRISFNPLLDLQTFFHLRHFIFFFHLDIFTICFAPCFLPGFKLAYLIVRGNRKLFMIMKRNKEILLSVETVKFRANHYKQYNKNFSLYDHKFHSDRIYFHRNVKFYESHGDSNVILFCILHEMESEDFTYISLLVYYN